VIPSSAPTLAAPALGGPCAALPGTGPLAGLLPGGVHDLAVDLALLTVLALAVLAAPALARRVRRDGALAALAGRGYSAWWHSDRPAGEGVFWGRLEARDGGIELAFDRAYATNGEPRRRALLLDGTEATDLIALVRAHTAADLSATLVRDEVLRRARAAERARWWRGPRALVLGAVEAIDRALPCGGAATPRPRQDARFLEGRRGERVVVELDTGARLAGRLVAVGRAWLALVDDDAREGDGDDAVHQLTTSTLDAPVLLERDGRGVELSRAQRPFVLDELRDDERTWKLGVVLLPGASLFLPWYGDLASNVRARVRAASGVDLLVPRARARVVFAGADDAPGEEPAPR